MIALFDSVDTVTSTGLPICPACSDAIEPDESHDDCLADTDSGG